MPNKRSAMKAHRVAERRYARNRPVRSALRTFVKKARGGIAGAAKGAVDEATSLVAEAAKQLDQAASKGIIHKNQAARRKSRLMHQLAIAAKAAAEPREETAPATGRAAARRRTTAAAEKPAAKPRATRAQPTKAEAPADTAEKKPAAPRTRRTTKSS